MAYVTSRSYGPPRVRERDLSEFLDAFKYDARRWLIPERGFEPWPEQVAEIARKASSRLRQMHDSFEREVLTPSTVGSVLEELRSEFSDYPLFALAVGTGGRLRETAQDLARAPMYGQLLVLIPEQDTTRRNFEVLDPIPAFSVALHAVAEWPGIAFWTANGASAFAPVDEIDYLRHQLEEASHDGRRHGPFPHHRSTAAFDAVLRRWSESRPTRSRRLLHLSDLHFGTTDATENQPLLEAELRDVVKTVDRVVITGDLFDTPKKDYATLFTTFRNNITHLAGGREPISITGNHEIGRAHV